MFNFLFKKSRTAKAPQTSQGPVDDLEYDPKLIAAFTAQHQTLVGYLVAAQEAAKSGRYGEIAVHLAKLRNDLQDHLIQENLRLYTYLGRYMTGDDNRELMTELRQEMGQIGRAAMRFLRHYVDYPVTAQSVDAFMQESNQVAGVLLDRIRREEGSLYSLYMPRQSY